MTRRGRKGQEELQMLLCFCFFLNYLSPLPLLSQSMLFLTHLRFTINVPYFTHLRFFNIQYQLKALFQLICESIKLGAIKLALIPSHLVS